MMHMHVAAQSAWVDLEYDRQDIEHVPCNWPRSRKSSLKAFDLSREICSYSSSIVNGDVQCVAGLVYS